MVDAVFLIDSSLSVRELCPLNAISPPADNWDLVLNFVSEVVGAMPVDSGAARVGIATFATSVSDVDVINLGQTTNSVILMRRIRQLPFLGGNTNMTGALRFARAQLAGARAAAAADKTPRKQYVILLTDGANNVDADPVHVARLLKQDGVRLITVGISLYVDEAQLKEMASAPAEYSYIYASDFSHLNRLVGQLLDRLICNTPPPSQRKTRPIILGYTVANSNTLLRRHFCSSGWYTVEQWFLTWGLGTPWGSQTQIWNINKFPPIFLPRTRYELLLCTHYAPYPI